MKSYTPPPGFIDLPFIWAFDGSELTDGENYRNLFVYLIGGYGNFILRRVAGLDRVLNPSGTYQIKDRNNLPWQSDPVVAGGSKDLMIAPELEFPETGFIRFDLANVQKPALATSAQVAFQGVRRISGSTPRQNVNPKSFTYIMEVDISGLPSGGKVTGRTQVVNYPFLLEQVMLFEEAEDGTLTAITDPVVALILFDQNKVAISNIPVLDIFVDGSPGSALENGAMVTPLPYRKDSQIQIEFTVL